jgi:hypothetical protein
VLVEAVERLVEAVVSACRGRGKLVEAVVSAY